MNEEHIKELSTPEEKCWVNWRFEEREGKRTKVPYMPNGENAKSTEPTTWSTLSEVEAARGRFDGIGIVFTGTLLGIDLDHCIVDGRISDKVSAVIEKAHTYTEVSPSGNGLHLYLRLTEPMTLEVNRSGNTECYAKGRYFTVTGNAWKTSYPFRTVTSDEALTVLHLLGYPWGRQSPSDEKRRSSAGEVSLEDGDLLKKMFAAKNGEAIKALYSGDISAYGGDDSTADAALCAHLAFWTGKDATQMECLWLASPLGQREKTANRRDYRNRTITFAIANCTETYRGDVLGQGENENVMEQCRILLDTVPKDTPKENLISALNPLLEVLATGKSLAEAELYIRNKVKDDLDLKTKDVDSILKHFKEIRGPILAKIQTAKEKAVQLEAEPPLTEEEKQTAEYVLKSPTLLFDILQMVKKLGVVGEERNILLHYIIFTSRKLKCPLSATVKGDSSAGKSHTLMIPMKLFPKSAYIDLTDATPQSFFYCPEDYFIHKIIVIFEKHGGERADYAIRTLQSEGKLKIQVTVKNPTTGEFEAKTIEKDGPTGFITTTTSSFIHAENDTRNISMFPDQSSEQTMRVYESVDSRYLGVQPISKEELRPWHHAQLILEELPVYIPFVKSFRKYFPAHIVRTRRDYGHFLAIIETIALLHQKQRGRIEVNGKVHIRATLADAYMAQIIVENSLSKSIYELPEKTIEVIRTAKALLSEPSADPLERGMEDETFTITVLARKLGWDRDTTAKWMKPATKKGYMSIVTDHKGPKGSTYKLEEKDLPGDTFLPSIEVLAADNPSEITANIYNPLTGEKVSLAPTLQTPTTDAPITEGEGENTRNS